MIKKLNRQLTYNLNETNPDPSIQAQAFVALPPESDRICCNNLDISGFTYRWRYGSIRTLLYTACLMFFLTIFGAKVASAESTYPDLRDAHDPVLQKAIDAALGPSHPEFWSGVKKKEFGIVVADVTDLHHPKVAWYNPNLMLYAASLPKKDRKDVEIYRKSGTWRTYHADSAVVAREDLVYIAVYIDNHPEAGRAAVDGIRIIDDVMLEYANRNR